MKASQSCLLDESHVSARLWYAREIVSGGGGNEERNPIRGKAGLDGVMTEEEMEGK